MESNACGVLIFSFTIDEAPVKFWILPIANALARREYSLSSMETIPTNRGAKHYLTDLGEGTATFEGDLGTLRVAERARDSGS